MVKIFVFIGRPIFNLIFFLLQKIASKKKTPKPKKVKKVKRRLKLSDLIKIDFLKYRLFLVKLSSKIKLPKFFKDKKRRKRKPLIKNPKVRSFLYILLALTTFVATFYFLIFRDLPAPSELTKRPIQVSTKIYDRNGEILYQIYKNENRTPVKLNDLPTHVILATLAAEDAEFYNHKGFSIKGILRALNQNVSSDSLQGGSTITQQLVKNALLTPEKTLIRKIREFVLSIEVELTFSKDEILEMYLNEVSYGGTVYGIEEASKTYFGKPAKDLTIAQAALLAGLTKSPTKYSPFGQNPELAIERQKDVLHLMLVNKFIDQKTEEEALNEKIVFEKNVNKISAPHFVMYVRQELVDKYTEEVVSTGGLEVHTTLDMGIQTMAEQILKEELDKISGLHVGNGAAIVLNPQTGEILAMVGSKDYFNTEEGGNVNVTIRPRQPGSSIKVVNYAYALSHGYSATTVIDDSPITFSTPGSPPYSPKNYDGTFKGPVTLRIALAESRNVPAVKVLATYGVDKMIEMGKKMGITTWEEKGRFGLSLTLGGGEVRLIDLAQVFATIANKGNRPEVYAINDVENYKGKQLQEPVIPESTHVLDERISYILTDILKDNIARSEEFGLNSYLVIKNHPEVAVKTGTSNDLKDNLTVGYNQNYLVAVWVGNNDGSPMSRVASGVTGASPIWNRIMTSLLEEEPSIQWSEPDGVVRKNCGTKSEVFLKEDTKSISSYCQRVETLPDTKDNKVKIKVPQIL